MSMTVNSTSFQLQSTPSTYAAVEAPTIPCCVLTTGLLSVSRPSAQIAQDIREAIRDKVGRLGRGNTWCYGCLGPCERQRLSVSPTDVWLWCSRLRVV